MSWAGLGRDPNDKPAQSHSFQWLEQAQKAEQSARDSLVTGLARTNAWRYAGHSYLQAAYQSANRLEFQDRMKRAGLLPRSCRLVGG